jgi:putative transposase
VSDRREKDSHRRRKAKREVAKQHLTIRRQRRDFHVKTAKHYAERYRRVGGEELNVG